MSEPVYFLKLELENVRCFGEKATLDLSDGQGNWKKWTVVLGDNGTGKTTLLKILGIIENQQLSNIDYSNPNYIEQSNKFYNPKLSNLTKSGLFKIEKSNNKESAAVKFFLNVSKKDSVYPQNHSDIVLDIGRSGNSSWAFFNEIPPFNCFGYGANRFMDNIGASPMGSFGGSSETLYNDYAKLINAEEWLIQLDYASSRESGVKSFAEDRRELVTEVLLYLLPEITAIRFTTPTKENLTPSVEFKTEYGYWVSIHQLSLGYKTMVAWMVDLAARMFKQYPDSDNPLAEPAIVLVDEIDLHLHPKWQRKIFDYLSDKFPNTQFIVTAHSPLVVQSAPKDANIVVLRKEGNHVIIDNDIKSVRNWRLDQIMSSDLFGETARNPEVEKWLEERTTLLQKQSLTPEEKIKLAELNKKAHGLPTAESETDIEAMEIIRKAAEYLTAEKA